MLARPCAHILLSCLLFGWTTAVHGEPPFQNQVSPEESQPRAVDQLGDLLPFGAKARLGTDRFRHGSLVYALKFSPNGKVLASLGLDSRLRMWDSASGKELRNLPVSAQYGEAPFAFSS